MAVISEELVLYDRFTNTFTSYIKQGERAAGVTDQAKKATEQFTQSQKVAASSTKSLTNSLRGLIGGYIGLRGIKSLFDLSDTITATNARLKMMTGSLEEAPQLNEKIYQSAMRSRSAYADTANFVAKLGNLAGNAFSSNDELVAFSEQINKQMVLSGTSAQEANAAMLQLTQGLSSGALRGEELNSVLEQTPMIGKTIAKYMGVTTGQMRELASQGKVTAEVVKNAMLEAAAETDAAFAEMPMTWGQVWTSFQNIAIKTLQPVLTGINFLANNIQIIGPLVLGLAGAFAVFQIAANWTKIAAAATGAYHFVVRLLSIGFGVLTGNTAAASAAVFTFNSALLASPITWVVMGVMLLVAALYAGVAAFNKLTGSSVSATGIIAGAFLSLGAFILNGTIVPVMNAFSSLGNFVANFLNDPVASVKVLIADMGLTAIGWVRNITQALEGLVNLIPGVQVDFTSWLDGVYNNLSNHRQGLIDNSNWTEYFKKVEPADLYSAARTGYDWGTNLFKKDGNAGDFAVPGVPYSELDGIEKNVGKIAKAVDVSNEDIRHLVDVAERRYVNNINLTSQTPVINITGQNTGNTAADRLNLANAIRDILVEQVASGTTRSTAQPVPG